MRSYNDSSIQNKINSFDVKTSDGFPVAKASKFLYKNNPDSCVWLATCLVLDSYSPYRKLAYEFYDYIISEGITRMNHYKDTCGNLTLIQALNKLKCQLGRVKECDCTLEKFRNKPGLVSRR